MGCKTSRIYGKLHPYIDPLLEALNYVSTLKNSFQENACIVRTGGVLLGHELKESNMQRQIRQVGYHPGLCCPGHDKYPNDVYGSVRSKRARARDIKKEHQHARSILKRKLYKEIIEI